MAVKVINYSGCEDPDFSFYFVLHFEQPLTKWFAPSSGEDGKILLSFGNIAQQVVHFSSSFISEKQAQLNLAREISLRSTEMLQQGIADWHNYFDRLKVTHENPEHTKTFYHTLYRTFLFPQTFYELDENQRRFIMIRSRKRFVLVYYIPIMAFGILIKRSTHCSR